LWSSTQDRDGWFELLFEWDGGAGFDVVECLGCFAWSQSQLLFSLVEGKEDIRFFPEFPVEFCLCRSALRLGHF
jgi:hypothetical protein